LPNGLTMVGSTITGTPTTSGTTNVTLTNRNGSGTSTATLAVAITSGPSINSSTDTDGDGFPDEIEQALGTSSADPTSVPFELVQPVQTLIVSKMKITLKFNVSSKDTVTFSGLLPEIPPGDITMSVGGIIRILAFNQKGMTSSKEVKLSPKNGKLTVKLRGEFYDQFAEEGLTDADVVDEERRVLITLLFHNKVFQINQFLTYKAKQGRKGTAKF